ncbi:MAG: cytochrome b/b6 domain-containing protein [Acetobacteraceae bacterium]|nr:cytochrome b/b6 domain-containing protein [Acetobacteraceae bacterium]MDW8399357.1 cytochrome b/b6 domain-containing protein [Acetobacteraceae bacterium]
MPASPQAEAPAAPRGPARPERFSPRARALHWVIAGLVVALLASGFAAGATAPEGKAFWLRLHLPLGVLAMLLALWRLQVALSEAIARRRPVPAVDGAQARLARAVHGLLFLLPIALGVSGIALSAWSGAPAAVFGQAPMPEFWDYPPRWAHGAFAWGIALLAGLHVAAALYHQFVRRDGLIGRMLPGPEDR